MGVVHVRMVIRLVLHGPDVGGIVLEGVNVDHPAEDAGLERASGSFAGFLGGNRAGQTDLSTTAVAELRGGLDLAVSGLVALYQAARADLESQPEAAILITCGGLAINDPKVDAMAVKWSAMGLAIAKAAQHKLAAVLHHHLQPRGIFVGEVVVTALVKGTAFDSGNATLEPAAVAAAFWDLYRARTPATRMIP